MLVMATTLEKSALSFCDAIPFQYRSSRTVPTLRLPILPLLFAFITRRWIVIKKARSSFTLVSELHPIADNPLAFTGVASRWADTHLNLSRVISWEREHNCVVEKSLRSACRDRFLLRCGSSWQTPFKYYHVIF